MRRKNSVKNWLNSRKKRRATANKLIEQNENDYRFLLELHPRRQHQITVQSYLFLFILNLYSIETCGIVFIIITSLWSTSLSSVASLAILFQPVTCFQVDIQFKKSSKTRSWASRKTKIFRFEEAHTFRNFFLSLEWLRLINILRRHSLRRQNYLFSYESRMTNPFFTRWSPHMTTLMTFNAFMLMRRA